jgi:hypothetical protein
MPFLFAEPYMARFFGGAHCPDDVRVPVADVTSWAMFPLHNRVYNKVWLCRVQGIPHAPLPIPPPRFPVFVKPITNLLGMSIGTFRADSPKDVETYRPGHFWMELLTGPHISTDVAVADGRACWSAQTRGHPIDNGRFNHWERLGAGSEALDRFLGGWIAEHLKGYSGIVNFETIGGRIIECHLRMSVEFIPLYGRGWLDAVVGLYRDGSWRFDERGHPRFMVPSFTEWKPHEVDRAAVAAIENMPGVRAVFPTINDGMPELGNPPNGFRRAVVIADTLEQGRLAADMIPEAVRPLPAPGEEAASKRETEPAK